MNPQIANQTQQKSQTATPVSSGLLQRACACGNHTMAGGECAECGKKKGLGLQTKLKVNEPGDIYEQEADRIADQVMATPAHPAVSGALPRIQRFSGQSNGRMNAAPASVDQALASPGRPLEPALRQDMEQRFGHDFSRVRVHSGAAAEQSARDMSANAYTVGHNIVFDAGRFSPGTYEGRRLMAHELAHVVQQEPSGVPGFRASYGPPTMVYREVGSGGSVSPRRIVYLDNDVVGEVVDGNKPVAEALMKMRASGPDVRITRYNYVETTHGEPIRAGARRLVVAKLGITIDEGGGLASREATYTELSSGKSAAVQPKDVPMLAAVRAAGSDAELWSLDGGPKENARRFGVRLAPESSLAHVKTPLDVRVGLDNVGLQAYEIASDGTPVRRGQLLPGKAAPSGNAPSGTTGGPPSSAPTGNVKSAAPVTGAHTGAPLEPVVEATPGFNPGRGAGIGGAFQLLQAMQFGNLQQAEIAKYEKRLAELQPKIDAFLSSGYSVELILIMEKPNSRDFGCAIGAFCDQSQFIYYHDLYINYVESVKPVIRPSPRATPYPTMGPAGGRDALIPFPYQGGSSRAVDEKMIRYLPTRDPLHHCEYAKHTLYPQESIPPIVASRPPAQPAKPKPQLDEATKKALALAPSRVYILSGNVNQYKTAYEIQKKLTGNASFVVVKEEMTGALNIRRTKVSYFSDLDKPRAEALAEIVRSEGVSSVYAELSGDGDDAPGVLQIFFGIDAEKPA